MTRTFPTKPIFGVGAIVFRDEDVLLIKRGQPPLEGQWSLPGGAVELGEGARDALHREMMEETGLRIEIEALATVVDIIDRDENGAVRHHYVVADYKCSPVGGTLKAGGDAAGAKWVPLKKLKDYHLTPKAAEVIIKAWKS